MNLSQRHTISTADYELLKQHHPGLVRQAMAAKWQVTDEVPATITLEDVGLERLRPVKAPWETPQLTLFIDSPPTLEEYVAAGYSAETYGDLVARFHDDQDD